MPGMDSSHFVSSGSGKSLSTPASTNPNNWWSGEIFVSYTSINLLNLHLFHHAGGELMVSEDRLVVIAE